MAWLDFLFSGGIKTVDQAGSPLPQRTILNFASGVSLVDNPGQNRTDVTVTAVGGATQTIVVPIGQGAGNYDSVNTSPAGAVLTSIIVSCTTAFDVAPAITCGTPGVPSAYLVAGDTAIATSTAVGPYVKSFAFGVSASSTLFRVVKTGASTVGVGNVYFLYSVPLT